MMIFTRIFQDRGKHYTSQNVRRLCGPVTDGGAQNDFSTKMKNSLRVGNTPFEEEGVVNE